MILNERKKQFFKHKEHSLHQLIDKIKLQTFWWL